MKSKIRLIALLAIAVLGSSLTAAWGATPSAKEILGKMAAASKDLNTLQASYNMTITMKMGDQDFSIAVPLQVATEKPNKFRFEMTSDLSSMLIVCDGTKLWQYMPQYKQVKVSDAPKDLSQAPAEVRSRLMGTGAGLLDGITSEESIAKIAKTAKVLGIRKLDGRDMYVMQVTLPKLGNTKVWLGTQNYQLYRAEMEVNLAGLLGANTEGSGKTKAVIAASDLKVNQPIQPEVFQFKMPEGAQVVTEFGPQMPSEPAPAKAP